jgi:hypothetical protein
MPSTPAQIKQAQGIHRKLGTAMSGGEISRFQANELL